MIDRFGNIVRVAWAKHEMEWLRAAVTLPLAQRMSAFHDISDLTGRSFRQVRSQAGKLRCKLAWNAEVVESQARRVMAPIYIHYPKPKALPSDLRQPTRERLMGCR